MQKNELLNRICIDTNIMMGKPPIRGTPLTVQQILGLLAQGMSHAEVVTQYKQLQIVDIFACLLFATEALNSSTFIPFL